MSTTTETEFLGEAIPTGAVEAPIVEGEQKEKSPGDGTIFTTECLNGGCIDGKP